MRARYLFLRACLAVVSVLSVSSSGWATVVVNGDFENTAGWGAVGSANTPAGWTALPAEEGGNGNPASQQAGASAIGGSGTSAYMEAGDFRGMRQTFAPGGSPLWTYRADFATNDPGGAADRTADMALNFNGGNIFFRVVDLGDDGIGDVQFHLTGSGWTTVTALQNSVTFSSSLTTAPSVNHLQIVSHFNLASPTYDAIMTNASGTPFTALGLSLFNTGTPTTGSSPLELDLFNEGSTGWVVDNVQLTTVPEPATFALLVTGLLGLLAYAWKKRK